MMPFISTRHFIPSVEDLYWLELEVIATAAGVSLLSTER
jgi:hypothetical protein